MTEVRFLEKLKDTNKRYSEKAREEILGQPGGNFEIREIRAVRILGLPRPRRQTGYAGQSSHARGPCVTGRSAAQGMALAPLRCAVRLRTKGLIEIRIRGRERSADGDGNLLLVAARHPAAQDGALERCQDARGCFAREFQDLYRQGFGVIAAYRSGPGVFL